MERPTQPSLLASPPSVADFTPLSDHESSTPSVFFGAKPVLYAATGVCDLLISNGDARTWDVFREIISRGHELSLDNMDTNSRRAANVADMLVVRNISGFVTSKSLILNSALQSSESTESKEAAMAIPYPCISLHATQRLYSSSAPTTAPAQPINPSYSTEPSSDSSQGDSAAQQTQAIYLQLDMDPSVRERSNAADDEDLEGGEDQTVEILLVPHAQSQVNGTQPALTGGNGAKVKEIFEALSRCADLNPDPSLDDAGEGGAGGLAALLGFGSGGAGGMPGEGGWITSENAHEFEGQMGDVDEGEDGEEEGVNGTNGLGPGAGSRRNIDEVNFGADEEHDGSRPDGDAEETKWRRTG